MKLAKFLSIRFFDLDEEVETFFGSSIERLQKFPYDALLPQRGCEGSGPLNGAPRQPRQCGCPAAKWLDGRVSAGNRIPAAEALSTGSQEVSLVGKITTR
jgi:hypothetical protein